MKDLFIGFCIVTSQLRSFQPCIKPIPFLPPVKVGDKAPALTVARWLKGDSVYEFTKGNIYLVEFGFLACAPCQASIPHLTALSEKYKGRVQVIAINIWENNKNNPSDLSYIAKVQRFVQSMGEKIGFSVAVDVPQQTTADTWGGGAPKVFIIDKHNIIAWIGHPQNMEPVLEKIIAGSFDSRATAEQQLDEKKALQETFVQIWANKKNRNYQRALDTMDSLITLHPDMPGMYYEKYRLLDGMYPDNSKGDSLVRWLIKTKPEGFDLMYKLAHEIIESKYPNYELAIECANEALKTSKYFFTTAFILDVKAEAYFKKGDIKKAIQLQKKAVFKITPVSKEMADARESLQIRLKYYQGALARISSHRGHKT